MIEPLFVRVEKKKGNVRQPIPLPAGEQGEPQGANYSKEDVLGLENWLVTNWSGGGYYVISVTDSTTPVPQKHEWEIFYHPSEYPERTPPTLSSAAAAPAPGLTSQPNLRVMPPNPYGAPSAFPNGFPPNPAPQAQPVYAQQGYAPQGYGYGGQPQWWPQTTLIGTNGSDGVDRRRYEDQVRSMEVQLAKAREDAMTAQHRQELDRVSVAQVERFNKLEAMMVQLAQAQTKPAVDPAVEAMKEQNRILQDRLENEKREREAERRERDLKDEMRRSTEETQRRFEELMAAQQQNKGMDPFLLMMQQLTQQHSAAMQEQQRNFTAQLASLQSQMMTPRDILAMAKESSGGLDQATRSITNAYQDILQMSRQAVEQALAINTQGGSETIGLIKEGMERATGMAEKYIGGKVKEATVAQQAQAEMAKAQAMAMQATAATKQAEVQGQMLAAQLAARAAAANPQAQAAAPAAQPTAQNKPNTQPVAGPNGAHPQAQTAPANSNGQAQVTQPPAAPVVDSWSTGPVPPAASISPEEASRAVRRLGHTDEEWFGMILPQVHELRAGVDRFLDSLRMQPPRLLADGHVDGVEPDQAANVILQAGQQVMQRQLPILAMTELLAQERVAEFMDVLLPGAPQPYRDHVSQTIFNTLKALNGEDDDPDDDEDGEDDEDGVVVAPPAVAPQAVRPRA